MGRWYHHLQARTHRKALDAFIIPRGIPSLLSITAFTIWCLPCHRGSSSCPVFPVPALLDRSDSWSVPHYPVALASPVTPADRQQTQRVRTRNSVPNVRASPPFLRNSVYFNILIPWSSCHSTCPFCFPSQFPCCPCQSRFPVIQFFIIHIRDNAR
jgi:hypothetical protein